MLVPALFAFLLIAALVGTNFISNPRKAEAAIGLRGSSATANGSSTSVTLTVPSSPNAREGDVLLAIFTTTGAPTATLSGWTLIGSGCANGTTLKTFAFWKAATNADLGANVSFSLGATAREWSGSIAAYSGVNRTTPTSGTLGACSTSATASVSVLASSPTATNNYIIAAVGGQGADTTITPPNSPAMTEIWEQLRSYSCGFLCTSYIINTASYRSNVNSGSAGALTYTSGVAQTWAGYQFALNPAADPTLEQSAYRWLTDNNTANPAAAMALTNTAITAVKINDVVRLRMLLHVSIAELQVDLVQFKLRYALKGTGTCAAPQFAYGDVSASTGDIQFKNITPADGATITTTAVDPSHSGHVNIPHTFEKANNFATRTLTPSGQDAMWDFALTNVSAPANSSYCFKITTSADANINTYTVYPELRTLNVSYNQAAYRWFNPNNGTAPGTALGAGQDTAITQVNTNADFRLRMLIDNGGTDAIPVAYESFKLQYAVRRGATCETNMTTTDEVYEDVGTASGVIRYKDNLTPADNDTAVTATGDPTYLGHATNLQYYKEANNFTTRISQPATQAGLWDFSLTNNSAPFGTVYCFRAIKSDGVTTLNTYTQVPQLTIINPTFDQKTYRWYDSSNTATPPGAVRAATNVATTNVSPTAQFRLRMLVRIGGDPIVANTETFKLKYATKTAGTCGAYSDVDTASGAVRFNSTPTPADEASITTFADDPVDAGITIRGQTYQEANNFTVATATAIGEDAMWDFSLQTVAAPIRSTYCFKIVRSTDADINTYTVTPELSTIDPRYEQSAFRWLANPATPADTTPGAALAANNSPASDISQNTIVRLRMLVHVSNSTHTTGIESFKLQFAPRSGTCDSAFVGESGNFTDLAAGSGAFRYYDNTGVADSAAISANANDPSHGADTIVPQTYRESNPFTTVTSTLAGQDAMWDFAIINNSAAQNTSWCFRMIKTDGTTDFTSSGGSYSQVAELNTSIASMSQSAYRWFTNVDTADYLSVGTNPTSGDDRINATALDTAGGFIYMAGYEGATADNRWRIEKRSTNDAALVAGFGNSGCTTNTSGAICTNPTVGDDQAKAIAIDASAGFMYVVGYDAGVSPATTAEWRIEKRSLTDGSLASGTTSGGFVNGVLLEDVYSGQADHINAIAIDTAGGFMYLGGFGGVGSGNQEIRIEKRLLSNGTLVTAFDTDGIITEDLATNKNDAITAIALDTANGAVYFGGFDGSPPSAGGAGWRVEKRNTTTGAIVTGFGNHDSTKCDSAAGATTGVYCADVNTGNTDDRVTTMAIDSTYLFIAGNDTTNTGQWRVDRITLSTNTISAPLFTNNPVSGEHKITSIATDGTNIYAAGYDAGVSPATSREWRYEKRTVEGTLVTAFDGDGVLTSDVTAGVDEITTIVVDVSGGYIYGGGFDSGGANQWRLEKRKTSDGTRGWEPLPYASQDTKTPLGSGLKFRLRMTIHVSGENMPANGETLKLQYAQKVGTCDVAYVGEEGNFTDVGATGDISYADNSTAIDGAATLPLSADPSHAGHTNVVQTYEEANPFTFTNGVSASSDGLWDFALTENNTAFGNYCFRAVKNGDGSVISANVVPEIVFCDKPKTENLLRHGNFFCDDGKKKFFWN